MFGAVTFLVTRTLFLHLHTRLRRDLSVVISCLVFSLAPALLSTFNLHWQFWIVIWLIVGLLFWGKGKTQSRSEPVQSQVPHSSLSSVDGINSPSSHISPIPMSACKPGDWYLVVKCHHCDTRAAIPDLSNGKAEIDATYTWRCPVCDHMDESKAEQIERYQHPLRDSAESVSQPLP